MNRFALVMKFWTDGLENSDRVKNVNYTWKKLKELSEVLNSHGIKSTSFLYDFSPSKIIDDSIHISFPLGVYKKAEKTNIILNDITDYTHLFMFDCDTFFDKRDYTGLINLLKLLKENNLVTFDLGKLDSPDSFSILNGAEFNKEMNYRFAYSGDKELGPLAHGLKGNLGGVYIAPIKLLDEIGGFNNKFVGWGEEDGEIMERIRTKINPYDLISCRDFFPIHLSHFTDWSNPLYSNRYQNES